MAVSLFLVYRVAAPFGSAAQAGFRIGMRALHVADDFTGMAHAGMVDVRMQSASAEPSRHAAGARRFPVFQHAGVQGGMVWQAARASEGQRTGRPASRRVRPRLVRVRRTRHPARRQLHGPAGEHDGPARRERRRQVVHVDAALERITSIFVTQQIRAASTSRCTTRVPLRDAAAMGAAGAGHRWGDRATANEAGCSLSVIRITTGLLPS